MFIHLTATWVSALVVLTKVLFSSSLKAVSPALPACSMTIAPPGDGLADGLARHEQEAHRLALAGRNRDGLAVIVVDELAVRDGVLRGLSSNRPLPSNTIGEDRVAARRGCVGRTPPAGA